jgi:hypothetical protein
MPARIAAVTMAYNEPDYVPIWVRHYGFQVGAEHCYLVDHGSDDGSTEELGAVNVLRLPRSPQDDPKRARFLSGFCASLLRHYDWVVHTDIDELAVADPRLYARLSDYAAGLRHDAITAIGLDIHQVPSLEGPIGLGRPIGAQRRWARFTSSMCKPVLIRRSVNWAPGFHCASGVHVVFDALWLFHLRYYDLDRGLARLAKTRAMAWAVEGAGSHQRMGDADWAGMFRRIADLPRRAVAFDPQTPPVSDWLDRLRDSMAGREAETYRYDLHINADELWEIPDRFRLSL